MNSLKVAYLLFFGLATLVTFTYSQQFDLKNDMTAFGSMEGEPKTDERNEDSYPIREMTAGELFRRLNNQRRLGLEPSTRYGQLETGSNSGRGLYYQQQQREPQSPLRLLSKRTVDPLLRKRQIIYFRQCFFNPISCY